MDFFKVVAICVVIVSSIPPATSTPLRTGVSGPCTGNSRLGLPVLIRHLATVYNETFRMVTALHNIYTPKDNQPGNNPRISMKSAIKLRRQRLSHFPGNIINDGSINVTVALANDYKTVQEMKALYDRMIRLENKCDKNRTDHVNETISYIQNHIERTSCYINTTRFTFPYQHPILDLPDGDLPVEFWNMTDTCETDDSNRHRNDYVIIVNTLNYTLSRSHYYSSVNPPYY